MSILKQAEGGVPVLELCREHEITVRHFTNGGYKWQAKFGGMDALMISEMKELADG